MLKKILHGATWPLRQLWYFLGRLGQAERKLLEAVWRYLGQLGLALRNILAKIGALIGRPLRWLLLFLWKPLRWLGVRLYRLLAVIWRRLGIWGLTLRQWITALARLAWRPIRWLAPYLWEELGRLGTAARKVLAVLSWPLVTLGKYLWRQALWPIITYLRDWVQPQWVVAGRAIRSRGRVYQARRRVKRQERLAIAHSRPRQARPGRSWIRLIAALAASNIVLIYLLVRLATYESQPIETVVAAFPTPAPIASSTPLQLPTATLEPTLIPITPAPPPDRQAVGGSVAYVARYHGNDDIFAVSAGRSQAVRLTNHPADDRDPVWSPDGRQLAFSSHRDGNWDLYLLEVATGQIFRLTQTRDYEASPSWSPDGQWLVFESYREENLDIYIMQIAGGDPIRLTSHPSADYAPAWAPSGRHIAFISWRSGNPDIHLFPLDDARDEAVINLSRSPSVDEDNPRWRPGGEYLTFDGRVGAQELVYAQPMLNNLPSAEPYSIAQGREPSWSPSGNSLIYAHAEAGRHYLLANAIDGWGTAPEVFVSDRPMRSPSWNSAILPPGIPSAAQPEQDPPSYREVVADPAQEGPPYTLVSIEEIRAPGPFLNDRVDDSFRALRQRVIEQAGWDFMETLDKIWDPMDSAPPPGLDAQSWNKAGRAFDLVREFNIGSRPLIEVAPEYNGCATASVPCNGTETWWRVYVRAQKQDGSQGEPLHFRPWNFHTRYSGNTSDYEAGGQQKGAIPIGYYVDFTQLAADYGWERVPAEPTWRTFFPAILFWHFEKRDGMTWEAAMQELYTIKELDQLFGGFEP